MKRILLFVVPSFLAGTLFGAAFWYLASPLWIDRVVAEELAQGEQVTVLSRGVLSDVDAVHRGKGDVAIVRLPDGRLEAQLSGFEVTNGPDLEVWLSSHPGPRASSDVAGGGHLSLGALKGNIGDQSYPVPAGTDLSQFGSLVIWCEQFGVLFSSAPLG